MPRSRDCAHREQSVIDEGQLIAGHYRLLERIGSGSMGVVWRARDERLERVVAIKQLLPQPGLSDEQRQDARKRALREARIAARLHHPNAIVVFDVAEHDGDPCLVMEYLPAKSLAATLADRGSMPAADVAAFGSQIASALAAAHASGIVHRDIKPGNILITDEGVAKITDFGIARAQGDVTVTQTGMFAGTPAYLAPEVARGQDPTSASDVFSFGATLYDAVEGGPPFPERQNQLALLRLVAEGKVQPPRQAGVLTALLMQLLRTEAAERPTMSQASRMLADLASATSDRPLTPAAGRIAPTLPGLPAPDPAGVDAKTTPVEQAPVAPPLVTARPLLSDRPAAYRPPPKPTGAVTKPPVDRRLVLIAVVLLVIVVVVVGVVLLVNNNGSSDNHAGGTGGGGQTQTTTQTSGNDTSSTSAPATSTSAPPVGQAATSGSIDFGAAGTMVLDYYRSDASVDSRWNMLSPGAQAQFGSESAFQQYWSQFSSVSSRGEHPVQKNSDGSVTVPADVTVNQGGPGSPGTHHKELRVVQEDGRLLIDADTRF
ncbi:MAG TPA: serine/threonine-protein kinase [Pseudonocardiaceae bacterium]|jgi:serine/threonine protein kinase|nr:serine/threonine-protein kinase [Pseudonocardiaceae bacterium]